MDAEVSVVRGAVKAEIDAEWDRCPGGILRAAVETYLHVVSIATKHGGTGERTLFAGLVLSFSNIFSDSDFGANAMAVVSCGEYGWSDG
jgi:hypothetical protein